LSPDSARSFFNAARAASLSAAFLLLPLPRASSMPPCCTVQHEGVELARGSGKSKKAAESDAALAALKKLREESGLKAGS
jgi:hypothetical protein